MSEYVRDVLPGDTPELKELKKLNDEVLLDPDDYSAWEKLMEATGALGGGGELNRNSDPAVISAFRNIYDNLLHKFPLFFGYWQKYALAEFRIAGTEAAELVFERGVACVPTSVDLWVAYARFKKETTLTNPEALRTLFETAADAIGIDYGSDPFWDEYVKFEESENEYDNAFAVLERAIHVPMGQYQRFYEKFSRDASTRELHQLLLGDLLDSWKREVEQEFAATGYTPQEIEIQRALRSRADAFHHEIYNRTQIEVAKRYDFERGLKRSYYVPTELGPEELTAWRKYLDFEEAEGDYKRIVLLYERCLGPLANYDEFWLRYARWMTAQGTNGADETTDLRIDENIRNIYTRAACLYCPIGRTHTRMHWANWEESKGRVDVARDIHQAVLWKVDNKPAIVGHLAELELRHNGLDAAIKVFEENLPSNSFDIPSKGWLVSEWACMLWEFKGDSEEARAVFVKNAHLYLSVSKFWVDWLRFELGQPTTVKTRPEQLKRVKSVMDDIQKRARLPLDLIRDCASLFRGYLSVHGGPDAMKEWIIVDGEVNGPMSVQRAHKRKLAVDGDEETTKRVRLAENGHPGVAINDADFRRGVDPYARLFQQQGINPYGPNGQPAPLTYTPSGLR